MHEITCPSGLRGVLRGMKVKDEQLFTDRKLTKSGQVITRLLDACWVETQDPGPYNLQGGRMLWGSALSSDRTYTLLQLRIASHGPDYEFRVTCSNGVCQYAFGWGVDLSKFDIRPVSEAGRQAVKSGVPAQISLVDGRVAKCKLLTGDDEQFFASLGPEHENKMIINNLARRIVELDSKTGWLDIVALVEDMESKVADALLDATDDLEGGVETGFDVECPKCHSTQSMVLPFEPGFFSSRKRFAPTKKKAG